MEESNKISLLTDIKEYFLKIDNKYIKFLDYFDKYWKDNNLLNFQNFAEEKYQLNRTNNFLERFHLLLNYIIDNFDLEVSF